MQPILTDAVVGSVSQSVILSQSWAVPKWMNWSRCHLRCGLRFAQGTTY